MNYEFKNRSGENFIFDGNNIVIFNKDKYDEKVALELCKPIDGFRTKYFSHVALILNNNCNLGCDYCYANQGNFDKAGDVMDFDIAKKVIEHMFENIKKHKGNKLGITFFGGEPLLQFDLIKKIVEYVNEVNTYNYHIAYSTITNGTLFTDEIIDFLRKNNFIVTVSLDGTKEAHDKMRKFKDGRGSFDVIAQNVRKYKNQLTLKGRLTVNDYNTNIVDSVFQIKDLGIDNIIIGVDSNISDENFKVFMENYKKLMEIYFNDLKNEKFYCIENITFNLAKIVTRRRISSHCNAGRAYFTISADGKVYDCHRLVGIEEGYVCDANCEFTEKIDCYSHKMDEIIKQNVGERISSCKDCSFKYLCGGMCYHQAYTVNGKRFSKVSKGCLLTTYEMKVVLDIITSLNVEQRKKFISYIMGLEKR